MNLLIADFKHPDEAAHLKFTGVSGEMVLRNLERAADAGMELLIRIPLIHGVNDDEASFEGFRQALTRFGGGAKLEVLRYHEYGKDKWAKAGLVYQMQDAFLPAGRAEALEKLLKAEGLQVIRT